MAKKLPKKERRIIGKGIRQWRKELARVWRMHAYLMALEKPIMTPLQRQEYIHDEYNR